MKLFKFQSIKLYRIVLIIFLILFLPVWVYYFLPEYFEIPQGFNTKIKVDSFDNFYDKDRGLYSGEKQSSTNFSYEAISGDSDHLIVKNTFDVESLAGEKIFSVSRLYGINAHTAMHVPGLVDRAREGYLFAPRMKGLNRQLPDKSPFDYWHVNYDLPIHMEYRDEDNIFGLSVYRYESNFSANQTKELTGVLPGVGEDKGIILNVHLELWVEPYTGKIVKYNDNAEAFYFSLNNGEILYPWNKFRNNTNAVSVNEQAKIIALQKQTVLTVEYTITGIVLLMLLILFLYPYIKNSILNRNNKKNSLINSIFLPFAAASLILVLTIVLALSANNITKQQRDADFHTEIEKVNKSIKNRFNTIGNLIIGARGLFDASSDVNRIEWHSYIDSLNLSKNYPGIQGIGFGKFVKNKDKKSFIDSVKKEGFLDFKISPEGEREAYVPVFFIEPFEDRNRRAFGFDMYSNKIRMDAMSFARDSGEIAMTGKVILAQESGEEIQPGFLIYEPIYKPVDNNSNLSTRRENIYGFTYAALRMNNFMTEIFTRESTPLGIEIYDGAYFGGELNEDALMYRNSLVSKNYSNAEIGEIELYNHKWTIRYTAPDSFGMDFLRKMIPVIILIIGSVVSILVFIVMYTINTRRTKAEIMAREITKELAYETNKLELATRSAKIGVWEWDVVKNILVWDDQMYALYGIKKEDFGGAYDAWQKGLHPDDKKSGDEAIKLALSGEKDFNTNFRVVWPNGEVRYMRAYATVERDNKGNPLRMVGVNFDITFEKEIDKAKTEFVSLASHQLKTPIGSIQWDLEMLIDGDYGSLNDKQKEVLNEARKMSNRMNELVNALLNISRIELGVFIIEPKPTDFVKLCEEVIREMENRIEKKGHQVIKNFDANMPMIPADEKLLRIVFQNFISNAIKYTPHNGTIKINLKLDNQKVMFSVANNGEPIPEGEKSKIFTKMYRASNAQKQDPDGNGLGLYLVKQIVENAGGKIWFSSKAGEDTEFACSFPLSGMQTKEGTKRLT